MDVFNEESRKELLSEYLENTSDKIYSVTYAILQIILCSVLGTTLNILALMFFRKRSSVFNEVFKVTAIVDIATCIFSFPVSLSYAKHRAPFLFDLSYFCTAWFSCWLIIIRFSVHLVAIMSVLRTIKIFSPFSARLKVTTVRAIMSMDFVVICLCSIISLNVMKDVGFLRQTACCWLRVTGTKYKEIYNVRILVAIPLIIIIISYAMSCGKILREWKTMKRARRGIMLNQRRMDSLVTILAFTGVSVMANTPSVASGIYRFVFLTRNARNLTAKENRVDQTVYFPVHYQIYILNYLFVGCFLFNSLCNPLIYYWRISEYKSYMRGLKVGLIVFFWRFASRNCDRKTRYSVDEQVSQSITSYDTKAMHKNTDHKTTVDVDITIKQKLNKTNDLEIIPEGEDYVPCRYHVENLKACKVNKRKSKWSTDSSRKIHPAKTSVNYDPLSEVLVGLVFSNKMVSSMQMEKVNRTELQKTYV